MIFSIFQFVILIDLMILKNLGITIDLIKIVEFNDIRRIQRIKTYINDNYYTIIGVKNITDSCGENYNTLRKTFKSYYGKTLKQYLDEFRIRKAKVLLRKTNLKCYAIAKETGFLNEMIFEKVFKRITDVTPGDYRNKE